MVHKAVLLRTGKIARLSVTTTAAALVVAGCTMGWVRPDTTAEQAREDNAECDISAAGKYPRIIVPATEWDANRLLRAEEWKYCMRRRGYAYAMVR